MIETIQTSTYQRDILDFVQSTNKNLIIQACAGSGKTTTLQMICEVLDPNLHIIAVAFNKAISLAFRSKLPFYVECHTLHSVGRAACSRGVTGRILLDEHKVSRTVNEYLESLGGPYGYCSKHGYNHIKPRYIEKLSWQMRVCMEKLTSIIYATMIDPADLETVLILADDYDIDVPDIMIHAIKPIIERLRSEKTRISFDDMLDHPLYYNYPIPTYDVVLVDEAQDLNPQQMALIGRMLGDNGRLICVGDTFQSIYAFRGADHSAMDTLARQYQCWGLPLSVCYRCGAEIVKQAQQVVGPEEILPYEDIHPGAVEYRDWRRYQETMEGLEPGDFVVCRTNAPLISPCLELIEDGKNATVRGAEIGQSLIKIVGDIAKEEHIAGNDIDELCYAIEEWIAIRESNALEKLRYGKAEYFRDLGDTLIRLAIDVSSIYELKERIKSIFSNDTKGEIIFSSIHRAKGLESSKVVLLGPELLPHPRVIEHGDQRALQQERNLEYVAYTRAIDTLIIQELPPKN